MKKIRKNRFVRSFMRISLALIVTLSLILPLYAVPIMEEITLIPVLDPTVATTVINAYIDSDIDFTIQSTKLLKNTAGDYAYTLVELSPYGYAIISNSNYMLLELCYTEDAESPLPMNTTIDFHYVAPTTFAVMGTEGLTLEDGTVLSDEAVDDVVLFENRINSVSAESLGIITSGNETNVIQPPTHATYTENVADVYFSGLRDYGENLYGTCTVVAAAILLGYYDHHICDNFIADDYTTEASATSSAGTTEAFHQLLCNYVYGDNSLGGIFISDAAVGLNSYLNSRSIPVTISSNVTHNVSTTKVIVSELIDSGRPAIASYGTTYGADGDHSVLVYGYKYTVMNSGTINGISAESNVINYDTLMFRVHFGWKESNYDVMLTADWFYQYGYVRDCSDTGGSHYFHEVRTYLSDNYHSGDYHYYKRELICCLCDTATTYDWVSEYCTRCVEYMSVGGELQ